MKVYPAPATKCISLILFLQILIPLAAFGQTSIEGSVRDAESQEPIPYCNISLLRNGVLVTGTQTDGEGNYSIPNLDPGTYDLEASFVGYQTQRQEGVILYAGKTTRLEISLSVGVVLQEIQVVDYKVPLIEQDNTTSGATVTSEQIKNLPLKSINSIASTTAGLSSLDGGSITIRGSRPNATDYYIDGIRVNASLIPQTEIEQLQVITGGIEAKYGDVTGGIISITTKGPSAILTGGVELETSEFLDPYGYNLGSFNLSGPLLKNQGGRSILGFRLSGQYLYREEDNPPATGVYRVREDRIEEIEQQPVTFLQGTPIAAAEQLKSDDANFLKARPNEDNQRLDLTAKIDAQLTSSIDITFSGSFQNTKNRFTPGGWSRLNWPQNPYAYGHTYRGNVRFRHRVNSQAQDARGRPVPSLIRNLSYNIQYGYERGFSRTEDLRHKDNLFRYGHIGNFDIEWVPAIGESEYSRSPVPGLAHAGFLQVLNGYTPGDYNPVLARYNNGFDPNTLTAFNTFNGFISSNFSAPWGLYNNVGAVYNTFNKGQSETHTANLAASFDLFPGGSEYGRHNIEFGLVHEQRINRGWVVAPFGLWTIARLQANDHIRGVDTNTVVDVFDPGIGIFFELFQTAIEDDDDLRFYRAVRELTGQSLYEYVNVDGLDPDDLSIDMFSPLELTDQGIIDYYGYDYTGRILGTDVDFDDFFTDVDENGRRTYVVPPNKPVYSAAYIQDKFSFRDIIFRVGLRVDRYDANTKVLKDPFSLYEIQTAENFFASIGEALPDNVQPDYKVYVDGDNSTRVRAYRRGEQWFFPNGTLASDANIIFGGEIVYPRYVDPEADIRSSTFDPDISFEDYTPQINWMPRLAVSFPISDDANFFAHYDILVQRPPSNTIATPLDYYYFEDPNRTPSNNPNLRPEKTIDYEVGFQQRLSQSSALKIAAYYKELRDMIQSRTFLYVPPPVNQYEGFGNLDFGTVKGFSLQYDLRRTGNLEFTANYTLQFADGTGSNALSQRGLTSRGNIRTLNALSFDERHRVVATMDYRFGGGRFYNGPQWFGTDFLANAGFNIQATAVSGRPYTRAQRVVPFGGTGFVGAINGARLPWNFNIDMRVDKSFRLNSVQSPRPSFLNVYVRVLNLLDKRNVFGVYRASGSPDDDGYLTSADGLSAINTIEISGRDVDAFLASYQWSLLNPGFYSLPRRIYLGAIVEF